VDIRVGTSVDQVVAQKVGDRTPFRSIELGCDRGQSSGSCDSGYSCAYTNSLAWRGPATPMPPETNPRLVFERLFGDIDTSLSPEVRARACVTAEASSTSSPTTEPSNLGPSDKRKLDEHLTSIRRSSADRAPERTWAHAGHRQADWRARPIRPNLMFDLQMIAFQTD
jgi:hypothetical protein